jgi:hypothetical protein
MNRQALLEQLEADNARTRAEIAERRARRQAGEIREWELPKPERKPAPPTFTPAQVDAIGMTLAEERKRARELVTALAEESGAAVGALEKELRDEITTLKAELAAVKVGLREIRSERAVASPRKPTLPRTVSGNAGGGVFARRH